jgi:hypothetical protein
MNELEQLVAEYPNHELLIRLLALTWFILKLIVIGYWLGKCRHYLKFPHEDYPLAVFWGVLALLLIVGM